MAKKIQIGTLDRRVTLVKFDSVKTTTGSPEKTEVTVGTFWAKIVDVSSDEDVEGQVISLSVRKYIMRYQQQLITEGVLMTIKDVDGNYQVHGVTQIGRKEYIELKTSKTE